MNRRVAAAKLVFGALLLIGTAACNAGPTGATGRDSGVKGTVVAGPVCPVSRPGSRCRPKPVAARLRVLTASGRLVRQTRAAPSGHFRIALRPGRYVLVASPGGGTLLPRPQRERLVVRPNHFRLVRLQLDTGIR